MRARLSCSFGRACWSHCRGLLCVAPGSPWTLYCGCCSSFWQLCETFTLCAGRAACVTALLVYYKALQISSLDSEPRKSGTSAFETHAQSAPGIGELVKRYSVEAAVHMRACEAISGRWLHVAAEIARAHEESCRAIRCCDVAGGGVAHIVHIQTSSRLGQRTYTRLMQAS